MTKSTKLRGHSLGTHVFHFSMTAIKNDLARTRC
jgi:hypothetical protein